MEFTRTELRQYDTIEQSHSGDELKIIMEVFVFG
jgi:hypothetical protein